MRAHAITLRSLFCVALLNIRIAMVSSKCASAFDNSFSTPMSRDGLECVALHFRCSCQSLRCMPQPVQHNPRVKGRARTGHGLLKGFDACPRVATRRDVKRGVHTCTRAHCCRRRMETTTRPIARALNRGIPNRASLTFFWDATCGRLRCLWQLRSSLWL